MRRPGHDAQIVNVGVGVQAGDLLLQKGAQLGHVGVAGDDGVKVDGRYQVVLVEQVALDAVNDIMAVHDVGAGVHLHMEADQPVAGAVVVDHQIMHAQHAGVAQGFFLDMFDKVRVRRRTQQRVDRVFDEHRAAVENKQRYTDAHESIEPGKAGQLGQHGGDQHDTGGDDIVAGIGGGGKQRVRVDALADRAVEAAHPELDEDGRHEHGDRQPAEADRCGGQYFGEAFLEQLNANDQNHHRNRQPGEIFIPRVAVGMLGISRARAELEADQADDVGAGVRQVV